MGICAPGGTEGVEVAARWELGSARCGHGDEAHLATGHAGIIPTDRTVGVDSRHPTREQGVVYTPLCVSTTPCPSLTTSITTFYAGLRAGGGHRPLTPPPPPARAGAIAGAIPAAWCSCMPPAFPFVMGFTPCRRGAGLKYEH